MNSKSRMIVAFGICSIAAAAEGQVTFYLTPGNDPNGDLTFQADLEVPLLQEFDFEGFTNCSSVPTLAAEDLAISVALLDADGSPSGICATIFDGGIFTWPGVLDNNTLLNGTTPVGCSNITQRYPLVEFVFSYPVKGFGAFLYDDDDDVNQMVMRVTDRFGSEFTSPPLDAANRVEGFLGAVSAQGITRAIFEVQDSSGVADLTEFFEMDHMQVAIDLLLQAEPDVVGSGATIDLTTSGGAPSQPGLLAVVDVSGTSMWEALVLQPFDGNGELVVSGTVPPGLSGVTATFRSAGVVPSGRVRLSNTELVTFL